MSREHLESATTTAQVRANIRRALAEFFRRRRMHAAADVLERQERKASR